MTGKRISQNWGPFGLGLWAAAVIIGLAGLLRR